MYANVVRSALCKGDFLRENFSGKMDTGWIRKFARDIYTIGKYFALNGDTINGLSCLSHLSPCDLIRALRNPLKS